MGRSSKCFKCSSWSHFCPCPQLKPQQLQINFLRPFMTKMPFKRLCIWGTPLGSFECLKRDSCGHFCTCPQPKPQQLKMDFLRRFMTKTPSKYDTPLQHVRRILVWGTPLGSFKINTHRRPPLPTRVLVFRKHTFLGNPLFRNGSCTIWHIWKIHSRFQFYVYILGYSASFCLHALIRKG